MKSTADEETPFRIKGIDPAKFRLNLSYHGPSGKPYYNLSLTVPPVMVRAGGPFASTERITAAEAQRLIEHLAATGFFKHAQPYDKMNRAVPSGYLLQIQSGKTILREPLGWDYGMLRRLDSLHRQLKGKPKKAMTLLIARLAGHRSTWNKGPEREGLQVQLSSERLIYRAGHPISIKLDVSNVDEIRHTFSDPRVDFGGLTVLDEQGRKVPHLQGPVQLQAMRKTIEPGKSLTLNTFDLTSRYYLRRPGRYTVQVPRTSLPASNSLLVIVKPDSAGTRDGDPVGRILPIIRKRWSIDANPNFKGMVRPGSNHGNVPGMRIFFTHTPTGSRRDLAMVWLWVTEKKAPQVKPNDERSNLPPPSEYLGKHGTRHVYLHASKLALKRWPTIKKDIITALSKKPKTAAAPKMSEDDRYRAIHDRYKAMILKAALEGRVEEVEKLTDRFNKTIDGRLLFVQVVNRPAALPEYKTVLSKFFGNRKITIGKLGFTYGEKPIVNHDPRDGYAVIATNPLKENRWPNDLQVTMAVSHTEASLRKIPRKPTLTNPAKITAGGGLSLVVIPERIGVLTSQSLELLQSCSYEATENIALGPEWTRAQKLPYLRIQFPNPTVVPFAFGEVDSSGKKTLAITELVIPISATRSPDYIFVRSGKEMRAFAKYRHESVVALRNAIAGKAVVKPK